MPSTAATEPDFASSNHNLLTCLALYQYRQDRAVGIDWMSGRVRGLLWYYSRLQQEQASKILMAAYLNGIIQQGSIEIKMLVARSEKAKDKLKILERVQAIEKTVTAAKKALDGFEEIEQ